MQMSSTLYFSKVNLNSHIFEVYEKYTFDISLLKKSLDITSIKRELKSIGPLKELKLEIKPPNPNSKLLDKIHKKGEEQIDTIKEANVTAKSIVFTSNAPGGLNLDANIIEREMDNINNIHSYLSSEEALSKGYAQVEAETTSGRSYSTKDNRPITVRIENHEKSKSNFMQVCRRLMQQFL